MLNFSQLQTEVRRKANIRNQATEYNAVLPRIINKAIQSIATEFNIRQMRRQDKVEINSGYSTGTGAVSVTNDSKSVAVTGATFLTDGIELNRYITFGGSNAYYKIAEITSETEITLDKDYNGDTSTTETYGILAQEFYNLPMRADSKSFIWHEFWGQPQVLEYIPYHRFYRDSDYRYQEQIPTTYTITGSAMVKEQIKSAGVVSVSSSDSADVNISITVRGIVNGYPDYEVITTDSSDGTTAASGSKSFSEIHQFGKSTTTVGRITLTGDSASTTLGVIPANSENSDIYYTKIILNTIPSESGFLYFQYYKRPEWLIAEFDVHDLGPDFDMAIIFLAAANIKAELNMDEYATLYALYQKEMLRLRKQNADKVDYNKVKRKPFQKIGYETDYKIYPGQAGSNIGVRV